MAIDVVTNIIIPAIVSAVSTAVPLYIGIKIGIPNEIDAVLNKLQERMSKSPTAKRALKMMALSDKLFGDEQAVEQITGFFKEARTLVSSSEAKNFFANVTELMKQLSTEKTEDVKLNMPTLPGAADDKDD